MGVSGGESESEGALNLPRREMMDGGSVLYVKVGTRGKASSFVTHSVVLRSVLRYQDKSVSDEVRASDE